MCSYLALAESRHLLSTKDAGEHTCTPRQTGDIFFRKLGRWLQDNSESLWVWGHGQLSSAAKQLLWWVSETDDALILLWSEGLIFLSQVRKEQVTWNRTAQTAGVRKYHPELHIHHSIILIWFNGLKRFSASTACKPIICSNFKQLAKSCCKMQTTE